MCLLRRRQKEKGSTGGDEGNEKEKVLLGPTRPWITADQAPEQREDTRLGLHQAQVEQLVVEVMERLEQMEREDARVAGVGPKCKLALPHFDGKMPLVLYLVRLRVVTLRNGWDSRGALALR